MAWAAGIERCLRHVGPWQTLKTVAHVVRPYQASVAQYMFTANWLIKSAWRRIKIGSDGHNDGLCTPYYQLGEGKRFCFINAYKDENKNKMLTLCLRL